MEGRPDGNLSKGCPAAALEREFAMLSDLIRQACESQYAAGDDPLGRIQTALPRPRGDDPLLGGTLRPQPPVSEDF